MSCVRTASVRLLWKLSSPSLSAGPPRRPLSFTPLTPAGQELLEEQVVLIALCKVRTVWRVHDVVLS